ncbi:MAG: transcriptional regulator PpsR [Sphingomonadaceae bacterium]
MNIASSLSIPLRAPHETLGTLDARQAARLVEAAGDLVLVLDRDGVVLDYALASSEMSIEGSDNWVGRRWGEIVSADSRTKVEEMVTAALDGAQSRWRQVNHPTANGDVPVRYLAVRLGELGRIVAVGRDLRANAVLQQRLLQAQQSLERDYLRLRQAEARYRVLFERATEAILVVDVATRRIREANSAAMALLGAPEASLVGRPFASLIDDHARDAMIAWLGAVSAADQPPTTLALPGGRGSVVMTASLFRQEQASYYLIRLGGSGRDGSDEHAMLDVMAQMPDGFVLTNAAFEIVGANPAFVDLAHAVSVERVRGIGLASFLGRAEVDFDVIIAQIREHGAVRNVATMLRAADGGIEEVELSAVMVPSVDGPCFGFSIRTIARRPRDLPPAARDLPRSVDQLTELVGRMSLKDIVRESTDLIERLCIEAALAYTSDNRASAAEILGLSRQSLYSKMHRHGVGNLGSDDS